MLKPVKLLRSFIMVYTHRREWVELAIVNAAPAALESHMVGYDINHEILELSVINMILPKHASKCTKDIPFHEHEEQPRD